jgi:hypothetical protein
MHGLETKDKKIISLLLSPSWFSGVLAVIVGLVLSVGVIVAFSANNSSIQQQLVSWLRPCQPRQNDKIDHRARHYAGAGGHQLRHNP